MKLLAALSCLIVAVSSASLLDQLLNDIGNLPILKDLGSVPVLKDLGSVPALNDLDLESHWEDFKKDYNKTYSPAEEAIRKLIWETHVVEIVQHNLQAVEGVFSYKRGINKYSDLTDEEIQNNLLGLKIPLNLNILGTKWTPPKNADFPDKIDWRQKGYVTAIKDQGICGSCWAFSATGALEGQMKKKNGQLVSLSEQNLVDCSKAEGNDGCNGGLMDLAFQYITNNQGIDTEASYPYTEQDHPQCYYKNSGFGATCTGFVDLPSKNEEALKKAVATVGPISIAINASGFFSSYDSGIYDPEECLGDRNHLNHGVLLVGYGTENSKDYWLIKNCWGTTWGTNGYMKMRRNRGNLCGVATLASYPLV
ncbi:cathepsin L [Nephila pilipes]|uniref:Cathepsin L n=1 Tax=Nephila pilipes TaxID=299642 RepID=A0A8X6M4Y5_NEPPI|nr:cathepsin L [Nephila pilipes]